MLPLHFHSAKPLIKDNLRLLLLTADADYGVDSITNPFHLSDRMAALTNNLSNPEPYEIKNRKIGTVMPHKFGDRIEQETVHPDIILPSSNHQLKEIQTKYQKGRVSATDLRPWIDFQSYSLAPSARGIERDILRTINELDNESIYEETVFPVMD